MLCFAELPWPASKQMIPQSEPGVEVVMWRKREMAFQFHSLQPVGDTVGAPWWGRAASFGALVGLAAQEQLPPGTGLGRGCRHTGVVGGLRIHEWRHLVNWNVCDGQGSASGAPGTRRPFKGLTWQGDVWRRPCSVLCSSGRACVVV